MAFGRTMNQTSGSVRPIAWTLNWTWVRFTKVQVRTEQESFPDQLNPILRNSITTSAPWSVIWNLRGREGFIIPEPTNYVQAVKHTAPLLPVFAIFQRLARLHRWPLHEVTFFVPPAIAIIWIRWEELISNLGDLETGTNCYNMQQLGETLAHLQNKRSSLSNTAFTGLRCGSYHIGIPFINLSWTPCTASWKVSSRIMFMNC